MDLPMREYYLFDMSRGKPILGTVELIGLRIERLLKLEGQE
jgi:hypothetical protein